MTRDAYIRMTGAVRKALARLPGGEIWLRIPTLLCACAYLYTLLLLFLRGDARLLRVVLVPAACFFLCTALRPLIDRTRPYDRFNAQPAGSFVRGKGKSMPSRHTASAAAIAFAVIYAFPAPAAAGFMLLLCGVIAVLRVLSGQHYISDVLAALALSAAVSLIGYALI